MTELIAPYPQAWFRLGMLRAQLPSSLPPLVLQRSPLLALAPVASILSALLAAA
jgi:hypothetical protein